MRFIVLFTAVVLLFWPSTFAASDVVAAIQDIVVDSSVRVRPRAGFNTPRRFRKIGPESWQLDLTGIDVQSLPLSFIVDAHRLYMVSAAGFIAAVDLQTRRVVWRRTSAELGVSPRRVLALNARQLLLISDNGEPAVVLARSNGVENARWRMSPSAVVQGGCPLRDRTVVLSTVDTGAPLLVVSDSGVLRRRLAMPWPELRSAHPLQRQLAAANDPATGTCVLALLGGEGFAVLSGTDVIAVRSYVEHVALPRVRIRQRRAAHGTIITESSLLANSAPISGIAADGGAVLVPFAAASGATVVDVYALPTGIYRGSIRLAEAPRAIGVYGSRLYLSLYRQGTPFIVAHELSTSR